MTHLEIREKFLKFFESRGHKIVPSSSLLPTDRSVLFTTAGMQQFKDYYTHPESAPAKNVVSIQKCLRTSDIDEVGDESHLTFFEMLGNFSFGGYWKKEAIEWAYEFITKEMGLKIDYVSIFGGEGNIPADNESEHIWKSTDSNLEVKKFGRADNFWGPTGDEGPCGPTTEIYVHGIEVWNLVFNEYYQDTDKQLKPLEIKGIDTGMGLERLAMVVQKVPTVFDTDLFRKAFGPYAITPGGVHEKYTRIFVDHLRAIIFLLGDGFKPSNKDAGYVLRRLIRRFIVALRESGYSTNNLPSFLNLALDRVLKFYTNWKDYRYLTDRESEIKETLLGELGNFTKTLDKGLNEFFKRYPRLEAQLLTPGREIHIHEPKIISGKDAFDLHQSYGFTIDIIKDLAERGFHQVDEKAFREEFKKHQEISRAGAEKKFGGHGLLMDTGELKAGNEEELKKATRLHTATHLLHASLRKILGNEVHQAGSDITAERLRFDFTFPRKMTSEEIKQVEDMVNEAVGEDYAVTKEEMPYEDAIKSGAMAFFKLKYPPIVNVFTIGPEPARGESVESAEGQSSSTGSEPPFSRELCGGPHVSHSAEVGKFKIIKEEAVSAGVRRIRAIVD